jgi:hypothetical protein
MKEAAGLLVLNRLIHFLSVFGGLILVLAGFDEAYVLIPIGVAAVLFSTLIFKVVQVFALHVEKSHAEK